MTSHAVCLLAFLSILGGPLQGQEAWPSFRGQGASGVSDGQGLPASFGGQDNKNISYRRRIPGLAHSSPIVWGGRIFLTSAVNLEKEAGFKHGLYGAGDAAGDHADTHLWQVLALDAESGLTLWVRTAYQGAPEFKRHLKNTYASSTPASDGKIVVAFFGSQGLYAYDVEGNYLWKRDFGDLDYGAYNAPSYEWGPASSPIIHAGIVYLQCDTQGEDFLIALDARDGSTLWRSQRDELPSWGTPTVATGGPREVLVTNASNLIQGYDPKTGEELWRLGGSSPITAPTPVFTDEFIVAASGRRPQKPIFAIRRGASGDLTLPTGDTSSDDIAWSRRGRGPYMPTPLIYRGRLYTLNNNGVFDCYDLRTGREIYRQRIGHGGSGFSASPVASDGHIFLSGEDGDVFVVGAGDEYREISRNPLGERLMATPAIAGGTLYIRGEKNLFAVRNPQSPQE